MIEALPVRTLPKYQEWWVSLYPGHVTAGFQENATSPQRFGSDHPSLNFEKIISIIIRKNRASFSIAALILEISLAVNNSAMPHRAFRVLLLQKET